MTSIDCSTAHPQFLLTDFAEPIIAEIFKGTLVLNGIATSVDEGEIVSPMILVCKTITEACYKYAYPLTVRLLAEKFTLRSCRSGTRISFTRCCCAAVTFAKHFTQRILYRDDGYIKNAECRMIVHNPPSVHNSPIVHLSINATSSFEADATCGLDVDATCRFDAVFADGSVVERRYDNCAFGSFDHVSQSEIDDETRSIFEFPLPMIFVDACSHNPARAIKCSDVITMLEHGDWHNYLRNIVDECDLRANVQ